MENKFQTSFIPKKPLTQGFSKPARTTNFVTLITTVIFITVLALCGGVFGYKKYLTNEGEKYAQQLTEITAQFQPSFLSELTRLDNRLTTTKTLLTNHLAVSTFFGFLSKNTLKNVRFSSFSYNVADNRISVSMKGQGTSYAAVALQAQAFGTQEVQKYIKNPTFSDLSLDASGNVGFGFGAFIQPTAILYKNVLNIATTTKPITSSTTPVIITGTTTSSTTKR